MWNLLKEPAVARVEWAEDLALLQYGSDLVLGGVTLALTAALLGVLARRKAVAARRAVLLLGFFLVCCGLGETMDWIVFQAPVSPVPGLVKGVAAGASLAIFVALVPRIRQLAASKDPEESDPPASAPPRTEGRERRRMTPELLQAQKLQSVGQLAAGIAHEISSPAGFLLTNLNTLRRYLEDLSGLLLAAQGALDRAAAGEDPARLRDDVERLKRDLDADFLLEDFRKALDDSREGGERVREIAMSLREFSHVDDGEMKAADLNGELEAALRLCWNEVKHKALVRRDLQPLPPVVCQPHRLTQVFVNLLVNAAQAISDRGEIRMRTRRDGEWAVVQIADSGCGIPPELRDRIFEPFFTTKPVGTGTGLGLHVARQIVAAHGGALSVSSDVGKGSEFTVRLPVAGPGGKCHGTS